MTRCCNLGPSNGPAGLHMNTYYPWCNAVCRALSERTRKAASQVRRIVLEGRCRTCDGSGARPTVDKAARGSALHTSSGPVRRNLRSAASGATALDPQCSAAGVTARTLLPSAGKSIAHGIVRRMTDFAGGCDQTLVQQGLYPLTVASCFAGGGAGSVGESLKLENGSCSRPRRPARCINAATASGGRHCAPCAVQAVGLRVSRVRCCLLTAHHLCWATWGLLPVHVYASMSMDMSGRSLGAAAAEAHR